VAKRQQGLFLHQFMMKKKTHAGDCGEASGQLPASGFARRPGISDSLILFLGRVPFDASARIFVLRPRRFPNLPGYPRRCRRGSCRPMGRGARRDQWRPGRSIACRIRFLRSFLNRIDLRFGIHGFLLTTSWLNSGRGLAIGKAGAAPGPRKAASAILSIRQNLCLVPC